MGPCGADDEWREDPSPRVRSLRLRLSVASLLLQALPITDQLPARPGILGQATPSGGGVLAWQRVSAHGPISPKRIGLFGNSVVSSEARDRKGLSKILPYIKVPLVANAHPLQVNSGIGFLRTLEGFSFVSGLPFPDNLLVGARSVLSIRARNGFDITADSAMTFQLAMCRCSLRCILPESEKVRLLAGFTAPPAKRGWLALAIVPLISAPNAGVAPPPAQSQQGVSWSSGDTSPCAASRRDPRCDCWSIAY